MNCDRPSWAGGGELFRLILDSGQKVVAASLLPGKKRDGKEEEKSTNKCGGRGGRKICMSQTLWLSLFG